MDAKEQKAAAEKWIAAWNKGDLNELMAHYTDDVVLHSPFVIDRWKIKEGMLSGKKKLQEHFTKAFESAEARSLQLVELLTGVDGLILIYKNAAGKMSADQVELNDAGKVKAVHSYY